MDEGCAEVTGCTFNWILQRSRTLKGISDVMVNPCVMTGSSSAVRPFHTSNSTQRHPARSTCLYISTEELPASWPAKTLWQVKLQATQSLSTLSATENTGKLDDSVNKQVESSLVLVLFWPDSLQIEFLSLTATKRIRCLVEVIVPTSVHNCKILKFVVGSP